MARILLYSVTEPNLIIAVGDRGESCWVLSNPLEWKPGYLAYHSRNKKKHIATTQFPSKIFAYNKQANWDKDKSGLRA